MADNERTQCEKGEIDVTLFVVSPNEVEVVDKCGGKTFQKKISAESGGNINEFFTMWELKELGAMIHNCPELKSPQFQSHTKLIVNLGKTLVKRNMTRAMLVSAITPILTLWDNSCQVREGCFKPPSREALANKDSAQLAQQVAMLQEQLRQQTLQAARLTPVSLLDENAKKMLAREAEARVAKSM